ncbi:hypothetical protein CRI94_12465 [Longibacter salinarum]|uniref:Sulfotransferase family protein n=1 Tax=Longibacter salinarum TaxID=1850348 RepID=A0A2A8CW23_9BACT|nr:sulfotransferase [Longibacter salinarum]PEN12813.1 hypothetical protein CRI94_12465 [Longibacter salinarum]
MKTKVLYIAGRGRSGSTILANCLNEITSYVNIGEANYAWENIFVGGHACGCGEKISSCALWGPVFRSLYGSVDAVPVDDLIRQRKALPSNIEIAAGLAPTKQDVLKEYGAAIQAIYEEVATVSGAEVIVDMSKTPSHLYLLLSATNLDTRVLHLVRDPRGNANSWSKKKKRTDVAPQEDLYMPTLSPVGSCRRYVACNLTLEQLLRRHDVPNIRLRYEDFCANPARMLESTVRALGLPFPGSPFHGQREITLGTNHTIWGNPGRAKSGVTRIREDAAWRVNMAGIHKVLVTALTLPFLLRYGYNVVPTSHQAALPEAA